MAESVAEAVKEGRLAALLATRDRLAKAIDTAEPQYVASLARQLSETLREIDGIQPKEVSAVDDLARARAARRAGAASGGSRAGGGKPSGGQRGGKAGSKRRTGS